MSKDVEYRSEEVFYFNTHRPRDLVLKLQDRYTGFDKSIIADLVETSLSDVKVVGKVRSDNNFGTGHLIFYVPTDRGNLVVRVNRFLKEPEHYMVLEEMFIRMFNSVGVPTNTIVFSDDSRKRYDFDYQIMKLLPGKDLETDWDGTKEEYDRLSYQLGAFVALEHKLEVGGWGRFVRSKGLSGQFDTPQQYLKTYLDYDLTVMLEGGVINEDLKKKIEDYFDREYIVLENVKPCLVHHDIADHNIRYEGERVVALFDWENAVAYDPVSDLASAHTWVCHFPRREKMTEGYLDKLGYKPDNFEERLALHFLRTMIWKASFAIKGGRFVERHRKLLADALFEARLIESADDFVV
ncbi:MAG: hypothetical protein QG623_103 [Patescibacteria group bacterium]|nr:hypothetical protein [Patescibacteria group bacterium]